MFEDLDNDSGFNPQTHGKPAPPSPPAYHQPPPQNQQQPQQQPYQNNQNSQSYQNNNYGNVKKPYQGGYSAGGGFGKKEEVLEDPYFPIAFYVEKDFPEEVKESLYNLASKMLAKKMSIRINADDKVFIDKLRVLSDKNVEVYMPWRDFNQIESKRTWNTLTSKTVAAQHFAGWEKIPDSVKAMLAAQVRMVFGDKNNSIMLCLITWSRDGASRTIEVTKDTGRGSFLIRLAAHYGFPVMNVMKPQILPIIEKTFNI